MIDWKLYNRRMARLAIVMTDVHNALELVTGKHVADVETARANLKAYDKASRTATHTCSEFGLCFSSLLTLAANNYNDTMKNLHLSFATVECLMETCVMNEETESEVNENEAE